MRIYITGASGRLGKTFLSWCKNEKSNCEVIALSRNDLSAENITNKLKHCKVLIHLAGSTAFWSRKELIEGNVELTKRIISTLPHNAHVVFASSISVYGKKEGILKEETATRPSTSYGLTKLQAEQIIKEGKEKKDLSATILRIAPIYGEEFKDYHKLLKLIKKGICPIIGNGKNHVPFVYVGDVCKVLFYAASNKKDGIFNISGECKTQMEIYEIACSLLKTPFKPMFIPVRFAKIVGWCCDQLRKYNIRVPITSEHIRILSMDRIVDCEKAKNALAFSPTPLKEGMKKIIKEIEKKGKNGEED
jgi:nucleoside-diphosphate-sugar epimerase